jgi:putative transposase
MQFENFTSITKRPVSVLEKCFRRIFEVALYQGTRLRVPYSKEKDEGFSPCFMAKPARNSSPANILSASRTFFVTSKTMSGACLLQTERNAGLLIDVMRCYVAEVQFKIHDFVVMPNHFHLLMTVSGQISIERAVGMIKGRFSYRLKKEVGYLGGIWQRGFSEVRVDHRESFLAHRDYIEQNPVKAGLVTSAEDFPFSSIFLRRQKAAEAKAC